MKLKYLKTKKIEPLDPESTELHSNNAQIFQIVT